MSEIPAAARALAQATFDAVQGSRALHQIRPYLSTCAFRQLVAYWDAPYFRVGRSGRLMLSSPSEHSVEACGTLLVRDRWLACTLRLDWVQRWICSEVKVVGYPA